MKYFGKYPAESGCNAGSKQARPVLIGVGVVTRMEVPAGAFHAGLFIEAYRELMQVDDRGIRGNGHIFYRLHVFRQQLMVGAVLFPDVASGRGHQHGNSAQVPDFFDVSSQIDRILPVGPQMGKLLIVMAELDQAEVTRTEKMLHDVHVAFLTEGFRRQPTVRLVFHGDSAV